MCIPCMYGRCEDCDGPPPDGTGEWYSYPCICEHPGRDHDLDVDDDE